MKQKIKELLDEMLEYHKNIKVPEVYLKKAYGQMELNDFVFSIGDIVCWLKEVSLGWENDESYEIDVLHEKRYGVLLSLCPALNELFVIKNLFIKWRDDVTKEEKNAISDYVGKNYRIKIKTWIRDEKDGKRREVITYK